MAQRLAAGRERVQSIENREHLIAKQQVDLSVKEAQYSELAKCAQDASEDLAGVFSELDLCHVHIVEFRKGLRREAALLATERDELRQLAEALGADLRRRNMVALLENEPYESSGSGLARRADGEPASARSATPRRKGSDASQTGRCALGARRNS